MEAERSLEQMDRGLWYKVDLAKIRDQENIASKFVQLSEDEATSAFIKHSFTTTLPSHSSLGSTARQTSMASWPEAPCLFS